MTTVYFDNSLTLKEKGLLCMLEIAISHGDNPTIQDLIRYNADGQSSISTAMKGLIEKGYIDREIKREHGKIVGVEYGVKKI